MLDKQKQNKIILLAVSRRRKYLKPVKNLAKRSCNKLTHLKCRQSIPQGIILSYDDVLFLVFYYPTKAHRWDIAGILMKNRFLEMVNLSFLKMIFDNNSI